MNSIRESDRSKRGYIVIDDNYSNVKIVDHKNRFTECLVKKSLTTLTYSPDEISEYGFENGYSYLSKTVNINGEVFQLFLERFYYSDISLYFLRYRGGVYYFIENEDVLTEITNENIADIFSGLSNTCNAISDIELSHKSMLKFLDCSPPSVRLVFSGGFGSFNVTSFSDNREVVGIPAIFDGSGENFNLAVMKFFQIRKSNFIDESNFFLGYGIDLTKYSFEEKRMLGGGTIDGVSFTNSSEVVNNQIKVSLPIVLRYWKDIGKIGFLAGFGMLNSINLNKVRVVNVRTSDGTETFRSDENIAPTFQLGFTGRVGISFDINSSFKSEITYGASKFLGGEYAYNQTNVSIGVCYMLE